MSLDNTPKTTPWGTTPIVLGFEPSPLALCFRLVVPQCVLAKSCQLKVVCELSIWILTRNPGWPSLQCFASLVSSAEVVLVAEHHLHPLFVSFSIFKWNCILRHTSLSRSDCSIPSTFSKRQTRIPLAHPISNLQYHKIATFSIPLPYANSMISWYFIEIIQDLRQWSYKLYV